MTPSGSGGGAAEAGGGWIARAGLAGARNPDVSLLPARSGSAEGDAGAREKCVQVPVGTSAACAHPIKVAAASTNLWMSRDERSMAGRLHVLAFPHNKPTASAPARSVNPSAGSFLSDATLRLRHHARCPYTDGTQAAQGMQPSAVLRVGVACPRSNSRPQSPCYRGGRRASCRALESCLEQNPQAWGGPTGCIVAGSSRRLQPTSPAIQQSVSLPSARRLGAGAG